MKQRISSLDLKILVDEMGKTIKGYRLQNLYNLVSNPRSFLFKFSLPDSKVNMVLESGFKMYMTDYQRPTLPEPSGFVQKLRKHLKTRRLTNIKQVADDRVCVMQFSDGLFYIVLEFFSAGNIILLDENFKNLAIFRAVDPEQNKSSLSYDIGEHYGMFDKSLFDDDNSASDSTYSYNQILQWVTQEKESNNKKVFSIAKLCFMKAVHLSSDLIQINLIKNNIDPSESCLKLLDDDDKIHKTVIALNSTVSDLHDILQKPLGQLDGYIISKKNPLFKIDEEPSADNLEYLYDEFHPFKPIHKITENVIVEGVKGYNRTVDKFFTALEISKTSISRQREQANAEKRLQSVKNEHAKKIQALDDVQQQNTKKGNLIMYHSAQIEDCKTAVQSLLDQQMDWKNIEKLIGVEKRRGNETAKMIKSFNFLKNEITVTLPDVEDDLEDDASDSDLNSSESESDSDSDSDNDSDNESINGNENKKIKGKWKGKDKKSVDVIIDITLSAFANSSRYFDAKKTAKEKQKKTELNAAHAIKSSEQKVKHDLKKLEKLSKKNIEVKQVRPKHWFEKFYWFISSDGYLCIAGRDGTQVDIAYYRYVDNNTDVLVSNDLEGALKVFIKNPYTNKDIPISTLTQAGCFSLTTTKAWENKNVLSPWFVKGIDVTKKDFDGSILAPGYLNVSKEKTYLPPSQLVMGAGLLWVGDETTTDKYKDLLKARIDEIELKVADVELNHSSKILELNQMLEKLKVQEEKLNNDPELLNQNDSDDENEVASFIEEEIKAPSPNDPIQTRIRGKKSKLKKIKEKYGDQDDEERRLRMSVLGTLKQVQKQNEDIKVSKEDEKRLGSSQRKQRKIQQQMHQLNKLIMELESRSDENDEGEEESLLMRIDKDPYYVEISGLIPAPTKTNEIVECVPVFAPWSALQKYTYKVKIQPGSLKKGKTVSEITETFKRRTKEIQKEDNDWFDKSGFVELINQQEFMAALTASKLKLSSPGVNNAKSKGGSKPKKGGKSKKK